MRRIILILLIAMLLSGCMPNEYPFKNANDSVVSVELLYNPYANEGYSGKSFELICTLDDASADSFMNEVISLKTQKCLTPPPSNYGEYVARVIYADGDIELFGTRHIELVECGSTQSGVGAYCFSENDYEQVFLKYVGHVEQQDVLREP